MLHISAKRHRFFVWWEDALWKTFWEAIWRTCCSIWFTCWVSPYNCEGSVPNPPIWKESFTWIVPRIRSLRGETLEGWRTDRRPWGVGDDGRIENLLEKTQCERGDISQTKRINFSNRRWTNQNLGGDQDLRTSTLLRHRPIRGESHLAFLGESEGSLPPPHDSLPDASEAMNDFWSMSGSFIYRHHVEPRVKLYSPREESFPITKYIDVSSIRIWMSSKRSASMILGTLMALETCLILGRVLHNLLNWKKTSWRIHVIRGEINKETAYIQARSFTARDLEINGKARQAEGEAKVVWGKDSPWKRYKIAWDLFHRPRGYGIHGNHQERA